MPTPLRIDLCNSMAPVPTRTAQEMEELQLLGKDMNELWEYCASKAGWLVHADIQSRAFKARCSIMRFPAEPHVFLTRTGHKVGMPAAFRLVCRPQRPLWMPVIADTVIAPECFKYVKPCGARMLLLGPERPAWSAAAEQQQPPEHHSSAATTGTASQQNV
jgi:hypothetical protein